MSLGAAVSQIKHGKNSILIHFLNKNLLLLIRGLIFH